MEFTKNLTPKLRVYLHFNVLTSHNFIVPESSVEQIIGDELIKDNETIID